MNPETPKDNTIPNIIIFFFVMGCLFTIGIYQTSAIPDTTAYNPKQEPTTPDLSPEPITEIELTPKQVLENAFKEKDKPDKVKDKPDKVKDKPDNDKDKVKPEKPEKPDKDKDKEKPEKPDKDKDKEKPDKEKPKKPDNGNHTDNGNHNGKPDKEVRL